MLSLLLIILIIVIDQVSKYFAMTYLVYNQPHVLLPFFNLTLNYNSGAAFGLLSDADGWQVWLLLAIALVVIISLVVWLWRTPKRDRWLRAVLVLIISGALGNLIDRVRFTYVIDFFDFHIKSWHFATFNVADVAISCGVIILIFRLLFTEQQ